MILKSAQMQKRATGKESVSDRKVEGKEKMKMNT
jgi:hypothetical protein